MCTPHLYCTALPSLCCAMLLAYPVLLYSALLCPAQYAACLMALFHTLNAVLMLPLRSGCLTGRFTCRVLIYRIDWLEKVYTKSKKILCGASLFLSSLCVRLRARYLTFSSFSFTISHLSVTVSIFPCRVFEG